MMGSMGSTTTPSPEVDPEDHVPAGLTPLSGAIFRTARAQRLVAGKVLRDTGLYPGQELLMMQLWESGEQRQADLITSLGLDPSTVTKMLQRLEQAGFLSRRPSDQDRRAVMVRPTRAGLAMRTQVMQAWRDLEVAASAGLTSEEYDEVLRLLARIELNLAISDRQA